jgi:two-component system sensor histidine kinase CiaH
MFNNIRKRLVILNATVILLVLSILSSLIFFHIRYRFNHDTDEILKQAQIRLQAHNNLSELLRSSHPDPQQDEKSTYLFWGSHGELIGQLPNQSFSLSIADQFRSPSNVIILRTVSIDKHKYRILQFPNQNPSLNPAVSIEIVRSLADTQSTLNALLWDIAFAIVAGLVISIFAGLFLAGRALKPIRNSWEKQQRFVADASHELRTPTAVIRAQTEMLFRQPTNTNEQESQHIAVILKESMRMNRLLDDLLTLARADSNQAQILSTSFSLDSLLAELSVQFRLLSSTQGIEIHTKIEHPLELWGDEGRIRQLLVILLDNALKYTSPSGQIEIRGEYQSQHVYICITDNGCGIAEEDLPYIFDRFYRGDKARTRAEGGTGLGLSLAQWIVNTHSGIIRVESKVNIGTRVELFFPRKKRGQS